MPVYPFTALNILPFIAVIGAIGSKVKTKKEIWVACLGSGLVLGVLSYIYNNSLIQIADEILLYEIPLFAILKNYSLKLISLMTILLWLAIFTTAAAGMLWIVTRLQTFINLPFLSLVIVVLLPMIPLTTIGFSTLVNYLYPAYGILNLYVLTRLLLFPIWNRLDQH